MTIKNIYVVNGLATNGKTLVRTAVTDDNTVEIISRRRAVDGTVLYKGKRYTVLTRWHKRGGYYVDAIFPQDLSVYNYKGPSPRAPRRVF